MADTVADANDAPTGRSDPGKIGPLPLWGWLLVGGGILAFFWWQRSHSTGSTPPTTAVGAMASDPSNALGVTQTDPLTADALLQAMNDLSTKLAGQGAVTQSDPVVSPTPDTPGVQHIVAVAQTIIPTHGSDTGRSRSGMSGINENPDFPLPLNLGSVLGKIKPLNPLAVINQDTIISSSHLEGAPGAPPFLPVPPYVLPQKVVSGHQAG